MKITRLVVTNYRGVRALDVHPGSGGAIVSGANMRGKTSILRSIAAALAAQDVGPDAIRIGEESAEVLVDLDELYRVRRRITKKGSSLKVSSPDGSVEYKRPQALLDDLLGAAGLDPAAIYLAKPEEKRRIVMAALPTKVTREQVQAWTDDADYWIAQTSLNLESMPGIEAISVLRSAAYDSRARANKDAKEAGERAARAAKDLPPPVDGPSVEDARTAMEAADRALERLQVQNANAEGARAALAGNRRRAEERRARAAAIRTGLPIGVTAEAEEALAELWSAAINEVEDLKARLRAAEERAKGYHEEARRIAKAKEEIAKGETEAQRLTAEAAELEGDAPAAEPVAADVLAAAEVALQGARAAHEAACHQEKARAQRRAADILRSEADAAIAHAEKLDRIVEALTKKAPAELAAAGGGIPGLTFEAEGIALDGVLIDKRSGAEQMRLAVEIARRAAGKARILVCDGLERMDSETLQAFVREATAGGEFQLIGTRVADGDLVIEAIEPGDDAGERSAAE